MTGHQIDNFVGSLVEMAKAFEERPELQRQIYTLENEVSAGTAANQALRESNDILRDHIAVLEEKVMEVTKERDDAGFRCLEADDKAARVLDLARTLASGLGQVIAEVEPVKPLVEEAKVEESPFVSFSSTTTTQETAPTTTSVEGQTSAVMPQASSHDAGQSEPGFTTHVTSTEAIPPSAGTAHDTSEPVPSDSVGSTSDKPYAGKRYRDILHYITLSDWLAGGGTDADYWT